MSANVESQSGAMNSIKWVLVFTILAGAVVGNYMLDDMSVLVRAIAVVLAIVVAGLIAGQTEKGRQFLAFSKEARIEVRKVVWPTRQETMHTTFIIMIATAIMALLLWGLDSILFKVVGYLTSLEI
ncbi:preprotein translocase subunit SecE [Flocculibacter collagenilyticus]|uniref:preprotein translocase subunit SecE n=1 Tax=Flocculibacter collagenilyticus TaxID=2744479 RepID=UPI0018F57245|nr:preprotein translocase subunit SecE [Flocculibacter collagenilyticus]